MAVSIERAIPEEQDHSANSERGHSSTSVSSAWEHTAGTGSETLTGSGRPSKLSWRERLRLEAGAFPGPGKEKGNREISYARVVTTGVYNKDPFTFIRFRLMVMESSDIFSHSNPTVLCPRSHFSTPRTVLSLL